MKSNNIRHAILLPVCLLIIAIMAILLWNFDHFAQQNIQRLADYRHRLTHALVAERLQGAQALHETEQRLQALSEQFKVSFVWLQDARSPLIITQHSALDFYLGSLTRESEAVMSLDQRITQGNAFAVHGRVFRFDEHGATLAQLLDVSAFLEQRKVLRNKLLWLGACALLAAIIFYSVYTRRITAYMRKTEAHLQEEISQHNAAKDALIAQQRARLTATEGDLMMSRQRYHTLFERTADALMMLREGSFSEANPACLALFECEDRQAFLGMHPSELSPEVQDDGRPSREKADEMIQLAFEKGSHRFEWMHRTRKGREFPAEVLLTVIDDGDSNTICAIVRDISLRKRAESEIKYQAYYDSLTGLPNRRLMLDRINQVLASSKRDRAYNALLFVDLDRFKFINDSLGHSVGDELLVQIAETLRDAVREEDTVARFGGDEFVILLRQLGKEVEQAGCDAEKLAEALQARISRAYEVNGHGVHVTSSIGIYMFPEQDESLDDIIKQADTAMYSAKDAGRNRIAFFQSTMQDAVVKRLMLEKDLREAVKNEALQVHYQPQINADGSVFGVEALARWTHPEHGFVSPEEFISIAEDSGIIYELGDLILRTAIKEILQLPIQPEHLAVNISPYQFRHPDFLRQVEDVVNHYRLPECFLVLEITEGVVINSLAETQEKLHALRKLGVRVSLDDFGTGYSSLSYLKRLPIDELKIDRSFIMDIDLDPHDALLVETIIKIAHQFDLVTVAEGVETVSQRDFLSAHECRVYQGYLYSKPLPVADLRIFLADYLADRHQA